MKAMKRWLAVALLVLISGVLLCPAAFAAKAGWKGYPYDYENEHFRYYGAEVGQNSSYDDDIKENHEKFYRIGICIYAFDPEEEALGELLEEDIITYTMKNIPPEDDWYVPLRSREPVALGNGEVWASSGYQLDFTADPFIRGSDDSLSSVERLKEMLSTHWEYGSKSDGQTEKSVLETTMFGYSVVADRYINSNFEQTDDGTVYYTEYTKYYIVIDDIDLPLMYDASRRHLIMSFSTYIREYIIRKSEDVSKETMVAFCQTSAGDTKAKLDAAVNGFLNTGSITVEREANVLIDNYKYGGGASVVIDTDASDTPGETGVNIPEALAIVIIGGAAALAGAGAGGSEDAGANNSKKKSRYKMCLKKDFGDAIRYDTKPVTVYARIVEITPEGDEIDRPDLTASLEIFTGGNLTVEGSGMAGNYMGAHVSAQSVAGGQNPNSGVLSIRFSGEGGSFQNNVTFRLIGKPYISLTGPNLSVLAGSGEKFTMPVEFIDFMESPANIVLEGDPLPISLEQNEEGSYYLEVADDTPKPETITKFYEEIPYTISADSGDETIQARFTVLKCYEGLMADFLGKRNEIMAYKNEDGEMPVTNIGFRMGLWDKKGQELNLIAPKYMEISYEDKEGIYEVIGLSYMENTDLSTSSNTIYSFTADKSLPSPDRIKGILTYSGQLGDAHMENETEIYLIPDLLTYAKDFEEEFKNCEHIIYTYMSGELMKRKAAELYRDKKKIGIKDLQTFRRHCWEIASRMVIQKREDYLKESYWYDERIAELELVTFVGDGAFAIALTPLGGPITAFLVDNAKSTFLELCEIYVKKGDGFTWEVLEEVIWNRFRQTIGSIDNFIGMPEDASWKVKTAWICSYFIYRVFYHWYYDEDDAGNSLGVVAAIENASLDFGVNRVTALFGDYVKDVAKKDGIDFSKRIKAEEDVVEKTIVGAFDMADKGADALDSAVNTIVDFIKSI